MKLTMKTLATACAGALLLACASSPESPPEPSAAGQVDAFAERNRRATQLAENTDYAAAIALWKELTAIAPDAPETAYLYRNLGYALFLSGQYDAALDALEKACLMDPLNVRGWRHLGSALRKLGQDERADIMFRQADTLERYESSADYALARGSRMPAIVSAVVASPRPQPDRAGRELDGSGGVIDLRSAAPLPGPNEAQAAPAEGVTSEGTVLARGDGGDGADPDGAVLASVATMPVDMPSTSVESPAVDLATAQARAVRLEVRNGNGIRGMAAATARRLAGGSMKVVRLTNQKGFGVERTRVEYVHGFQDEASKLAQRFSAARLVKVDNCWKADMRLVIGKDQAGSGARGSAAASAARRAPIGARGIESASADRAARPGAPPARG